MPRTGWIKEYRRIMDSPIYRDPLTCHAFRHCLLSAAYEPCQTRIRGRIYDLQPGQFATTREQFAKETGLTDKVVRNALEALKALGMIEEDTTRGQAGRLITVCNWRAYQDHTQDIERPDTSDGANCFGTLGPTPGQLESGASTCMSGSCKSMDTDEGQLFRYVGANSGPNNIKGEEVKKLTTTSGAGSGNPSEELAEQPPHDVPEALAELPLFAADRELCEKWDALMASWAQAYPAVDATSEAAKAHAWLLTAPKARRWKKAARGLGKWVSRAARQAGGAQGGEDAPKEAPPGAAPPALDPEALARIPLALRQEAREAEVSVAKLPAWAKRYSRACVLKALRITGRQEREFADRYCEKVLERMERDGEVEAGRQEDLEEDRRNERIKRAAVAQEERLLAEGRINPDGTPNWRPQQLGDSA